MKLSKTAKHDQTYGSRFERVILGQLPCKSFPCCSMSNRCHFAAQSTRDVLGPHRHATKSRFDFGFSQLGDVIAVDILIMHFLHASIWWKMIAITDKWSLKWFALEADRMKDDWYHWEMMFEVICIRSWSHEIWRNYVFNLKVFHTDLIQDLSFVILIWSKAGRLLSWFDQKPEVCYPNFL